jgi:hypothetical protein
MKFTTSSAALLDRPAGDRRIWFRLVTPELDRDGTITLPMGVRLENFRARPVFLWMHPLPQAAEDGMLPPPPPPNVVIGKVVEIEQTDAALDILVEFAQHEQAELCYQLVKDGFLGAVSYSGEVLRKEDRDFDGHTIPVIAELDLWEASLVIVGSNPGAQVLERAARALRALSEQAARTSPPEPQPPIAKRGVKVDKEAFHEKLGLPGDSDRESAGKALHRYLSSTMDSPEDRAKVCSAYEAHYPEEGEERAAEEPPPKEEETEEDKAKREEEERAAKAAAAEGKDEVDDMDEETAKAALRFALRRSATAPAPGADAKIIAEVDALIKDGQVENTPERRAEAIALHGKGKLTRALRAAGIKSGTFTTSQRLRSGRVGTETEIEVRAPGRRPAEDPIAKAKVDAKATIAAMDATLVGQPLSN